MKRNLLFNPGPTNVSNAVRQSIQTKDICHREPEFFEVLTRVNKRLATLLGGETTHDSVLFVSSGTGANEAICASIDGKVLVVHNGKYSDRICDILGRYHVPYERVDFDPSKPVDVGRIKEKLVNDSSFTHMYVVHHETTTGALAPLREIGTIAQETRTLLCVDGISSIGGHPFHLQKDHVAYCSLSANKCLESFPGVSFVLVRKDLISLLEGKSKSFYFDLYAQWKKAKSGQTPFTPAVQVIFAIDKALEEFMEEGYDARVERYRQLAATMRASLKDLGFELLMFPPEMQSNILTTLRMPEGFDYWKVHDKLKQRGITIYSDEGVLAQRKFRVATLGSITPEDVYWFASQFKEVLSECAIEE